MKFNQLDNVVKAQDTKGAAYVRPKLREFGQVGKLTQGGSGPMSETFYTMGPMAGQCMTQNVMRNRC